MIRYLPVLLLLLVSSPFMFLSAQAVQFHHGDWASALARADQEQKLIFLDAYTTWCGPCKLMDKQTFTDSAVGAYFNAHFINVKMNMEQGEGIGLARQFSVQAYPTLLFVDASGHVVHRVAGFHNADAFLQLGQAARDPERRLQGWDARYRDGDRQPDFLFEYAYRRYYSMDGTHHPVVMDYLATQEDWTTTKNTEFLFEFAEFVDDTIFRYLIRHREAFEDHFGKMPVVRKIEEVLDMANFLHAPDWNATGAMLADIYPNETGQRLMALKMNYYQQSDDTPAYVRTATAYFREYAADDADALNDAAWTFYERVDDPVALKEAIRWAQKAVKLDDNYHNNDTLAALYAKTGQKAKAKKTALHAIELARAQGLDDSPTRELLEQLGP